MATKYSFQQSINLNTLNNDNNESRQKRVTKGTEVTGSLMMTMKSNAMTKKTNMGLQSTDKFVQLSYMEVKFELLIEPAPKYWKCAMCGILMLKKTFGDARNKEVQWSKE